MVQVICPACSRENYTASPQAEGKCAFCECTFAIEQADAERKNDGREAPAC